MTYGLDRLFRDEKAPAVRPRNRYRMWRRLDHQSRLRLIEAELKPANGRIDGYPLAL